MALSVELWDGKKGFERFNHMKKYIKKIIYAPKEIEIKLIYKDYSVENAENLIVNNQQNVMNPNAAGSRARQGAGDNKIKGFSEFLEFEYEKMVAYLSLQTIFVSFKILYTNSVIRFSSKS